MTNFPSTGAARSFTAIFALSRRSQGRDKGSRGASARELVSGSPAV